MTGLSNTTACAREPFMPDSAKSVQPCPETVKAMRGGAWLARHMRGLFAQSFDVLAHGCLAVGQKEAHQRGPGRRPVTCRNPQPCHRVARRDADVVPMPMPRPGLAVRQMAQPMRHIGADRQPQARLIARPQ